MSSQRVLAILAAILVGVSVLPIRAQDLPAEPYLDDGFTWFEPDNSVQTVDGKRVGQWSLLSNLRVWGADIPNRSAFKVIVRDAAGGAAATYRFNGFPVRDANGKNVAMNIIRMRDSNQKLQLKGLVKLDVYFIDGDTDAEKLLKSYTLNVQSVTRVMGTPANPQPDGEQFFFSRHGDVPYSIISRRLAGAGPYNWSGGADKYDFNVVDLVLSHSPEIFDNPAHQSHVQVKVNGQPVTLKHDGVDGNGPTDRAYQAEQVTAPPSKTGPLVKQRVQFREYELVLPLTWSQPGVERANPAWTSLNDHPGEWEVSWIQGTNLLRIFRFKVNPDGTIAQHPEETGDLRLAPSSFIPDATLVETTVPGQGSIIDARLDPDEAKAGGFYGHVWQTAEMKAAAAAVPARNIHSGHAAPAAEVAVAASDAPAPAGIIFDDAFTWLTVKDHNDTANGNPFNKGWTLQGDLRLVGPVGERDTLRLRVTQNGKEMANWKLSTSFRRDLKGTNHALSPQWFEIDRNGPFIKETGEFQVEVYRLDGATNAESLMRTLQLTVGQTTRVRGNKGSGQMDSPMYYVETHGEVAGAVLYKHGYDDRLDSMPGNGLTVAWALSPTDLGLHLDQKGFVRITINGQRLNLDKDQVRTSVDAKFTATHTNWDKPNPRGGAGPYFEHLNFARLHSRLPVTWGPEDKREAGSVVLEEHPGDWVVEYRHEGDVIRTWKFTVNADGSIQPHPEQAAMTLPPIASYIEAVIPAGGSVADERLSPAAAKRGRLFMPWTTDAGKALAATVPSKGKPTP